MEGSRKKITTILRIRPILHEDVAENPRAKYVAVRVHPGNKKITLTKEGATDRDFELDGVAHYKSYSQENFYQQFCEPSILGLFNGFNTTFISYGTGNTGKTHTLFGSKASIDSIDNDTVHFDAGIIIRSIFSIFDYISKKENDAQFRVTATFMELSAESINDLFLEAKEQVVPLQIREDPAQGPYVEGLIEKVVKNREELLAAIRKGARLRFFQQKPQNKTHAILQIFIEQRWAEKVGDAIKVHHKRALLTFVDLGGAEKTNKSNKALIALSNCINTLADSKQSKHVPYRESKLTRLLADSLGGNSKTTFIACISPSLTKHEETLSTLMFLNAAGKIRTYPVINEDIKVKGGGDRTPKTRATPVKSSPEEKPMPSPEVEEEEEDVPKITFISQARNIDNKPQYVEPKLAEKVVENKLKQEYNEVPVRLQMPVATAPINKNMPKANKIIKRLAHTIRYLKGEVAKKNLVIRRLKEENTALVKEESKAKSTDMSEGASEGIAYESIFNQIMSNPHLKAVLIDRLQNEGYDAKGGK